MTGSGNDILGHITCKYDHGKESFLGKNLCVDRDSIGELLFPWGRHYLLVNNDLGSYYLLVNNDWGSHYFWGVIIYGYTGHILIILGFCPLYYMKLKP